MDAFELYNENGEPTGVWCCGKCRKLVLNPLWGFNDKDASKSTKEGADKCCTTPVCETCGNEIEKMFAHMGSECESCRSERRRMEQAERHQKLIDKATDVSGEYDGPVCFEGYGGDWGDGYFSSVETVYEYVSGEIESDIEDWAFACKSRVEELDIERMLECLCEDGYEDMQSNLVIPESLVAAVAEFNEQNRRALTIWECDYSRKVRVKVEADCQ